MKKVSIVIHSFRQLPCCIFTTNEVLIQMKKIEIEKVVKSII